jgi:hypothetical protein
MELGGWLGTAFSHLRENIVTWRPEKLSTYAIDCVLSYLAQVV